jgi:hypothetical protein
MPSLIGNKPNQVPSNGDLGTLAFQDSNAVNITGGVVGVSAGTASAPAITTTGDTNTGIFFPAADTIAFAEGGAECARFDSSGQLGIGTTSPASGLEIKGTGSFPRLTLSDTSIAASATIGCNDGDLVLTADSGGAVADSAMNFFVDTTEHMRIDSGGRLKIGTIANTPASSNTFGVVINDNGSGTPYLGVIQASSNGNSALNLNRGGDNGNTVLFRQAGTLVGTISVTGSATAYNTSSDYRLKENIEPMTGALATVQALKPVTYTWKSTGEASQGFIAHELAEVVPDAVNGEKDAVNEDGSIKAQGIDTSFLVATLTAAIQEQQAIITDLKSRIETLESSQG